MTTARRRGGRFSGGGDAGYSLIEMMVAIGMAAVIGAGLYSVMNSQRRSSGSQRLANELQTSCNFAMDQMRQDLLIAGYRADETDDAGHTAATKSFSQATSTDLAFEFFDDKAKFNNVSPSDSRFDLVAAPTTPSTPSTPRCTICATAPRIACSGTSSAGTPPPRSTRPRFRSPSPTASRTCSSSTSTAPANQPPPRRHPQRQDPPQLPTR